MPTCPTNIRGRIKDKMKKLVSAIVVGVLGLSIVPATASESSKSIAIIDYTFDTSRPELAGKVLADVCLSITKVCVNAPTSTIYSNETYSHGTTMATVASQVNPNIRLILIRVGNINAKTFRLSTMGPTEFDNVLIPAMDWVAQNRAQYNIVAVSTSMSHNSFNRSGSYCPIRKSAVYNSTLQDRIVALQSIGIAAVFSAGNTYDNSRASYPACIPQSIAVGATELTEPSGIIPASLKSAKGSDVDFYTLGTYTLSFTRMTGQTSPAAVAFASYWAKKYSNNYAETMSKISASVKPVYFAQTKVSANSFVDVLN